MLPGVLRTRGSGNWGRSKGKQKPRGRPDSHTGPSELPSHSRRGGGRWGGGCKPLAAPAKSQLFTHRFFYAQVQTHCHAQDEFILQYPVSLGRCTAPPAEKEPSNSHQCFHKAPQAVQSQECPPNGGRGGRRVTLHPMPRDINRLLHDAGRIHTNAAFNSQKGAGGEGCNLW